MPGRRTFLIGCGSVVAAPALAAFATSLAGPTPRAPPRATDTPAAAAGAVGPDDVALRIDGWHPFDPSDSAAQGEVWIHINSSWRAIWR